MRKTLSAVILAVLTFASMPALADNDPNFFGGGITMSGANNSGFVSKMNGGLMLDGEFSGERLGVFGSIAGVQTEKLSLGDTQQIDFRGGVTFQLTENFEVGAGYRNTILRFTEIQGERTDTAPFLVANYRFPRNMRLMTELHAPDSSQYETRAVAVAFEQAFGRHKNFRFRAKFDYAEFDYNDPIQSSASASQQGLVANTKSATAPEGYERKTLGSQGYVISFSYLFNGKK